MKNLFLVFLLLVALTGFSQKRSWETKKEGWSGSVGVLTSADGYGMRYSYMLSWRDKRTRISAGVLVQNQHKNLSGFEAMVIYSLTGYTTPGWERQDEYPPNLELATFFNLAYNKGAFLTPSVLMQEDRACNPEGCPFRDYRFSSVETYGGVVLKWRFLKCFKWNNYVGIGGYSTFNHPGNMYYKASCAGLMLRSELSFLLF